MMRFNGGSLRNRLRAISASGAAPASFLLDTYAGASFAYSFRQLRAAQTHVAIVRVLGGTYTGGQYRIVATPGGLTTSTPVTYDGIGPSGATTVADLVTGGGNNDVFVVAMLDQTGQGRDVSQATAGSQPAIAAAGALYPLNTGKPNCIWTISSRALDRLTVPASEIQGAGSVCTMFTVGRSTTTSVTTVFHGWGTGTSNNTGIGINANQFAVDAPSVGGRAIAAFTDTAENQWTAWRNGSTVTLRRNGGAFATNGAATGSISGDANFRLCGTYGSVLAGNFMNNSYMAEHVHYPVKLPDLDIAAIESDQKSYWGTP
jgi:hypothetical protein